MTDPCIVVLTKQYPKRSKTEIENDFKFMKKVSQKLGDRGRIRNFMDVFVSDKMNKFNTMALAHLDTLSKFSMNADRITNPKWGKDLAQAALSLYEESSSVVDGAGFNVDQLTAAKMKKYWGNFISDVEALGLLKPLKSGEFDVAIRNVIRTGKPDTSAAAKEVNALAGIVKKHYSMMNKELNAAGMRVAYRADYDGQIVHDGSKIYGNFKDWAASLDKALELEKEFIGLAPSDFQKFREHLKLEELPTEGMSEVQVILKDMYDRITKKYNAVEDTESIQRPVSIAERRARAKTFTTWKSGEAVQTYLNKYGKYSSIAHQMENYTKNAARDVGLVTIFGATPSRGHELIKDYVREIMVSRKATADEISTTIKKLDNAWETITRPNVVPENLVADIMGDVLTLSAQAKLGVAGVTSALSDPAVTTVQNNLLLQEGIIKSVYSTFKFYTQGHMEYLKGSKELSSMYMYAQNDLLAMHEEFASMSGWGKFRNATRVTGEMISKFSGARWMNGAAHLANAKMYIHELAEYSRGKAINKVMEADLKKFNITENDLQVIKNIDIEKNGMKNVMSLSSEKYAEFSGKKFNSSEEASYHLIDFQDRMSLWLLHKIKGGAPIPGARERRILSLGTKAGTVEGQLVRMFTQFKSTQHKIFLDNFAGANRRANPNMTQTGMDDYFNKPNSWHLGRLLFLFTMSGAMIKLMNDFIGMNEKEIKRWEDGDPTLLMDAFARGGAGYLLGDMFSSKSNLTDMVAQTVSTPAINAVVTVPMAAKEATVGGNPARAAIDLTKAFVPGSNLWFMKGIMQGMTDATKKTRSSSGNHNRKRL